MKEFLEKIGLIDHFTTEIEMDGDTEGSCFIILAKKKCRSEDRRHKHNHENN